MTTVTIVVVAIAAAVAILAGVWSVVYRKRAEAQLDEARKTADRIIEYRQAHGPFRRVQDLEKVEGVGKGVIERNEFRSGAVPTSGR